MSFIKRTRKPPIGRGTGRSSCRSSFIHRPISKQAESLSSHSVGSTTFKRPEGRGPSHNVAFHTPPLPPPPTKKNLWPCESCCNCHTKRTHSHTARSAGPSQRPERYAAEHTRTPKRGGGGGVGWGGGGGGGGGGKGGRRVLMEVNNTRLLAASVLLPCRLLVGPAQCCVIR